jgi:hypothetical protein
VVVIHVPVANASARTCTRVISGENQRWKWNKEKIMGIRIVPITKDSDAKRRKKTIRGIKGTPKEYSTSRTTTQKGIMKPNVSYAVDRGVVEKEQRDKVRSEIERRRTDNMLRKAAEKK